MIYCDITCQIVLRVTALFFADTKSNFEKGSRKDAKFCKKKATNGKFPEKKKILAFFSTNGMRKNAKTFAKKCDIMRSNFLNFCGNPNRDS